MEKAVQSDRGTGERVNALAALLVGATLIGASPIFVRLSELGPSATAFQRLFLALPFFWLWLAFENRNTASRDVPPPGMGFPRRNGWIMFAAGISFAADMAIWHWSVTLTSVANATLLANLAPVFVTLGAWMIFGKRISRKFIAALVLGILGAAMITGASLQSGGSRMLGDVLGVATAVCYGVYLLCIKELRRYHSTAVILFWSGAICAGALLIISLASGESIIAESLYGWAILFGLAWTAQCGGVSLISYAIAHLPASFSSVALLWQPVVAAFLGWLILSETLTLLQASGGAVVLVGIFLASTASAGTRT